ncbi:unnamed protein product [Cunninghamella blakesleeana]
MKRFIYTVFNEQSKPIEFISKYEDVEGSPVDGNTSTKKINNDTKEDSDQSEQKQLQLQLQLQLNPIRHFIPTKENKNNSEEEKQEKGKEGTKVKDGEKVIFEEYTLSGVPSTFIASGDPTPGMEFDTLADCRQFCIDFSKRNGFLLVTHNSSHKKGYLIMECVYHRKYRNAKKKKVPTVDEENDSNIVAKKTRNRKSKRKGCNCRIVFNRRSRSKRFTLTSMFLEHNHPLPTS